MTQSLELSIAAPLGSLDAYERAVARVPMLTLEEEQSLARRFRDEEDLDAARQLVMAHLRFVAKVARGYDGYGLPHADLIQEGNIGLMKAVKRFDPDVGVRLVSFAVHWIRAEMHEYILRNWRIVKVATTKAQRKLFFNLRSKKKRLGWLNHKEVESVAADLGVPAKTVLQMEQRLSAYDAGFDAGNDDDDDNLKPSPAGYLQDLRYEPAQIVEDQQYKKNSESDLMLALDALDERSKDILQKRWLSDDKATLHDLADTYGISAERIRQIEQAAMKKMRTFIEA